MKRSYKIQILLTEDEWLECQKHLDKNILNGNVKPRTSISTYYRDVLLNHIG